MLLKVFCFLIGIAIFQYSSILPSILIVAVLIGIAGLCGWKAYYYALSVILGLLWAIAYAHYVASMPLAAEYESVPIEVTGYISGIPIKNSLYWRFDFILHKKLSGIPKKLRLNWYQTQQQLHAGQVWQLTVKLKRPHGMLNPHTFDYEGYLFTQGIGATGYVRNKPAAKLLADFHTAEFINFWRQNISQRLDIYLADSAQLGIIKALAIGVRKQISESQWNLYRQTGTVHLLAISGLHIGLIAGFAYWIGNFIWLRTGILQLSAINVGIITAFSVSIIYASLAGWAISTQRAVIMLICGMLSLIYQRHLKISHRFALALLIILLINPLVVLNAGFWLSFTAVGLILYTQSQRLHTSNKFILSSKIHLITAFGLAPILLFQFQTVSISAPIANFIAVPIVSLIIVPLILLAVVNLFIFPALATQLLNITAKLLTWLEFILNKINQLPFAYWQHTADITTVLLAAIGIGLVLAPKGVPARWLAGIFMLPILLNSNEKIPPNNFKLTLLDVGQGLATVVQTAQHTLVFDTGVRHGNSFNIGKMVLLPFLRAEGVSKLDMLIISHADNDHIGGAEALISGLPVQQIYTSALEKLAQYNPIACANGQTWRWDGVLFQMLAPSKKFSKRNNNSCVLKISTANASILLTGDIEAPAEKLLVQTQAAQLASTILIAPHHGSKTSSSMEFLRQVAPEWALIPAGYKNKFKFPHAKVLRRYQRQNIQWLITANTGAITVLSDTQGLEINTYRQQYQRYWQISKE